VGLSIAKWIAAAPGGTITAESTPGEGAKFTVRLPAA
jgi:signal transduction histidine kinase